MTALSAWVNKAHKVKVSIIGQAWIVGV
jgi:hypothetical protein